MPLVCALTAAGEWVHAFPLGELAERAAKLDTTLIMVSCDEHDDSDHGYDEQRALDEHDCPRDAFLDDPITRHYGVGSEMVHLIDCPVCDARERGE